MHLFGLLRSPKVILANPVTMNSRNVTPTSSTAISIFTPVKCSYLGSHRLLSELLDLACLFWYLETWEEPKMKLQWSSCVHFLPSVDNLQIAKKFPNSEQKWDWSAPTAGRVKVTTT